MMKMYELYSQVLISKDYGVEVEVEFSVPNSFPSVVGWKKHNDGSLRNYGVEYISLPFSYEEHERIINELFIHLIEVQRYIIDEGRGGIHIHRNIQDLTLDELNKFVGLVLMLEPVLMAITRPERQGNHFCLQTCEAEASASAFIHAYRQKDLRVIHHSNFKYSAINLQCLSRLGTVEFRGLAFDMDSTPLKYAIKLIQKCFCLSRTKTPEQLLEALFNPEQLYSMIGNGLHTLVPSDNYDFLSGIVSDIWALCPRLVKKSPLQQINPFRPINPPSQRYAPLWDNDYA